MNDKTYNVLFLCTGNAARSIMAEAMLNATSGGRFKTCSAGSHPTGTVNPFACEELSSLGYSLEKLRSKSWDEFEATSAPHMDFVITVCDAAAGEPCPVWPGQPITAHWRFEDPVLCHGTDAEVRHAFAKVCREIKYRLDLFQSLPMEKLEKLALKRELDQIGASKP
ncbi:arsenate reductase ArsC [Massilia sp. RP-1-19]|uniref:Arsenate reductase ArsC n=1 Tax=Massilia polaris TaxID=2728846 RepID=A0A848HFA7_9BURK|nr:arsenate reductase ArsC [Massilia polaris]NML60125.1 arsenate reductase ArsC [Massilia polaris]